MSLRAVLVLAVGLCSCVAGVAGLAAAASSSNMEASTWIGAQLDLTILPSTAVTAPGGCTAQVPFYNQNNTWNYTSYVARFNRTYDTGSSVPFLGESIAATTCTNSCTGQAPCVCPNVVHEGYYIYTGSTLKAFDPFELLIQPGPSANFRYSWTSFASVQQSNQRDMVMSIDDSVPCCIPVNITGAPPSSWSLATGRRLGLCDLKTNRATYNLNWDVFSVDLTNFTLANQVQALVKSSADTTKAALNASASLSTLQPALLTVVGNVSKATRGARGQEVGVAAQDWQAFTFPRGCQTSVQGGNLTSTIHFQNISTDLGNSVPANGQLNGSEVPSWYLPSTTLPGIANNWFIAALNINQTTGPTNDDDWTWGRAFVDQNSTWQAFFSKHGVEWNVSRLVAPANFSIVGGKMRTGGSGEQDR